jgi:hypothetical protein
MNATKKFHQMTTEEKMNTNIFFKIGYLIADKIGECESYSALDRYYRYQNNVQSEGTKNGRVYTSILWLSPEIAEEHQMSEKIVIKTGAIKMKRDVFYKEKNTGNTVMTEPYEVVVGEGKILMPYLNYLPDFLPHDQKTENNGILIN